MFIYTYRLKLNISYSWEQVNLMFWGFLMGNNDENIKYTKYNLMGVKD